MLRDVRHHASIKRHLSGLAPPRSRARFREAIYFPWAGWTSARLCPVSTRNREAPIKTLREQIKGRIQAGHFPLFVTEGDSNHKRKKIEARPYLDHSYQRFSDVVGKEETVLFVFGHSLSDQDSHILEQMIDGSFRHLFVGLFNGAGGDADTVRRRAEKLKQQRETDSPLRVQYYDAESANIWNKHRQS